MGMTGHVFVFRNESVCEILMYINFKVHEQESAGLFPAKKFINGFRSVLYV